MGVSQTWISRGIQEDKLHLIFHVTLIPVCVWDFSGPPALRKGKALVSCRHHGMGKWLGFIPTATQTWRDPSNPQEHGSNYNCSDFPTTMLSEEWKWHRVGFQSQKPHVTWSREDLDNFMLFWLWCTQRYRPTSAQLRGALRKCVSCTVQCESTWLF